MTPDQREEHAREFVRRVEQRLLEAEAAEEAAGGIGYNRPGAREMSAAVRLTRRI
jgi:hypothetical protein